MASTSRQMGPKTLWWTYFMMKPIGWNLTACHWQKNYWNRHASYISAELKHVHLLWSRLVIYAYITNAYILGQMHSTIAPLTYQMQIMCYLHCWICWSNCGPTKYGWTDFQKQSLIRLRSRPFSSVATRGFVMLLMNTENNVQRHFITSAFTMSSKQEYQWESQQIKHFYHTIIWQVVACLW